MDKEKTSCATIELQNEYSAGQQKERKRHLSHSTIVQLPSGFRTSTSSGHRTRQTVSLIRIAETQCNKNSTRTCTHKRTGQLADCQIVTFMGFDAVE